MNQHEIHATMWHTDGTINSAYADAANIARAITSKHGFRPQLSPRLARLAARNSLGTLIAMLDGSDKTSSKEINALDDADKAATRLMLAEAVKEKCRQITRDHIGRMPEIKLRDAYAALPHDTVALTHDLLRSRAEDITERLYPYEFAAILDRAGQAGTANELRALIQRALDDWCAGMNQNLAPQPAAIYNQLHDMLAERGMDTRGELIVTLTDAYVEHVAGALQDDPIIPDMELLTIMWGYAVRDVCDMSAGKVAALADNLNGTGDAAQRIADYAETLAMPHAMHKTLHMLGVL